MSKKSSWSTFGPQKPFLDRFRRLAARFAPRGIGSINQVDVVSNWDRKNQNLDDMGIQDIARAHITYRYQRINTSSEGSRGGKIEMSATRPRCPGTVCRALNRVPDPKNECAVKKRSFWDAGGECKIFQCRVQIDIVSVLPLPDPNMVRFKFLRTANTSKPWF